MSAAELRRAAEMLRERAKAATPGPWGFTDSEAAASLVNIPDDGMVVMYRGDTPVALCADEFYENGPGEPAPLNDAQWIATMHPGVGLALADWLDFVERRHGPALNDFEDEPTCNFIGCYENAIEYPCDDLRAALKVARLINGGAS